MKGLKFIKVKDEFNTLGFDRIEIIDKYVEFIENVTGQCEHGNPLNIQSYNYSLACICDGEFAIISLEDFLDCEECYKLEK